MPQPLNKCWRGIIIHALVTDMTGSIDGGSVVVVVVLVVVPKIPVGDISEGV